MATLSGGAIGFANTCVSHGQAIKKNDAGGKLHTEWLRPARRPVIVALGTRPMEEEYYVTNAKQPGRRDGGQRRVTQLLKGPDWEGGAASRDCSA